MPLSPVVSIRRILSGTPLSRQHERLVGGRLTRRPVEIPWALFDRSKYPAPALAVAAEAQRALAFGEYTAVDLFARIASAMSLNGVPLDLVTAATRIPGDEARHTDYALRMASLCAGTEVAFEIDRKAMSAHWSRPLEIEDVDTLMLEVAAMSETLAGALIGACQRRATDPVAHALFTAILGDEVHHARLGWYYFAWRSPQWSRAERQRLADRAAALIIEVEPQFWRGRDAPKGSRNAARALGVLDSATQRKVLRSVMEDEIVPALDGLGLGASHAWRARRLGQG
jgi:hypothetical protein